ncbi:hypothetical protein [Streptomyces globosus]|uniref:hypothetical protein n=1 Tax=Streptomyces globosus TaxID=68209 RepID=UPI0031D30246
MTNLPAGRRTRARCAGALAAMAIVLSLAACDPAASGTAPSTSGTASAPVAPSEAPTSQTPTPSPTPTPSAAPSTAAPAPSAPTPSAEPAAEAPAPAPPAPTRTKAPAPAPTKAATDCYPKSNAGNCYRAGQICRKADVGTSGRDANGRTIHCRQDDSVGQRWGY